MKIIESHQLNERIVIRAVKDGLMKIDAEGRIWRIGVVFRDRWGNPPIIKPCRARRAEHFVGDYFHVRQTIDGKRIVCMAHRLVWQHFKGDIPIGYEINHRNGRKKLQNDPGNLECATRPENMQHAFRTGLNKANYAGIKFTDEKVRKCRVLRFEHKMTMQAIAGVTGISPSQVFRIVKNQTRVA